MRRWWSLAFLAAVGCASGVTREEHDLLKKKLEDLEAKTTANNNNQAALYADLLNKQEGDRKRLTDIDSIVKILDASLRRIEERLKTLGTTSPDNGKTTEPRAMDVATRTSDALIGLKTGKLKVEDVIAQLKPVAKDATPLLVDELKRSLTNFQYANQLVAILSNFPPDAVRLPVAQALGEPGVLRIFAARIVGNLRDKDTGRILEAHTRTEDEDFRLVLGESLVLCKNPAGIPLLVKCLSSRDFSNRVIAFDTLRNLNKGEGFGYSTTKPEANADAIKKWEDWAQGPAKTIFDSP